MDFDKKELSTYLDGIPFSIGHKFCPPRTVVLPEDAVRYEVPQELLSEKYEFSIESKVLADFKMEKEKAKEKQNQKTAKIKQPTASNGASTSMQPLWSVASILQPKSKSLSKNVTSARSDNVKKINLSDFENDSSSPFDYMELQTINDIEELSTVFQDLCKSQKEPAPAKLPIDDQDTSVSSSGNVSKSVSFPLPESFDLSKSTENSQSQPAAIPAGSVTSVSKSFAKNSESYLSYSYPNMPGALSGQSDMHWPNEKAKRNSFTSDTTGPAYVALSQVPFVSLKADKNMKSVVSSVGNIVEHPIIPLRSSKSIPDLTNLLPNDEAVPKVERSHTPPATRTKSFTQDEQTYVKMLYFDNSLKQNVWSRNGPKTLPAMQPNEETPSPCEQNQQLPDPYDELSNSEKYIVDFVTDMGFHRGQVSRTVKHLGTDEKKVVDHLCQIQSLEESGYDMLEAERALHLHDYNKNEAIKYLDLLSQFQDLGFEKDAIRKALVQNKNDRDKVIDALLS